MACAGYQTAFRNCHTYKIKAHITRKEILYGDRYKQTSHLFWMLPLFLTVAVCAHILSWLFNLPCHSAASLSLQVLMLWSSWKLNLRWIQLNSAAGFLPNKNSQLAGFRPILSVELIKNHVKFFAWLPPRRTKGHHPLLCAPWKVLSRKCSKILDLKKICQGLHGWNMLEHEIHRCTSHGCARSATEQVAIQSGHVPWPSWLSVPFKAEYVRIDRIFKITNPTARFQYKYYMYIYISNSTNHGAISWPWTRPAGFFVRSPRVDLQHLIQSNRPRSKQ